MTVALVILAVCLLIAVAALVLLSRRTAKLRSKYSVVIDADAEARRIREESSRQADKIAADTSKELERLQSQVNAERAQLETVVAETAKAKSAREQYSSEIALLEENLEDISFGVYKPHFDFDTPEDYKQALQRVVDKQKTMIRAGDAARFAVSWTVGGSQREGERMQRLPHDRVALEPVAVSLPEVRRDRRRPFPADLDHGPDFRGVG